MAEFPMVLILAGLAAYAVLGGADFGAGLWELAARGEKGAPVREHTHRAMAPVWEANHVWLIFVLVICWTAYPEAFASIATTLTVPLFIAGLGVILRGAGYAFRAGDPSEREESALSVMFSLSSILTPFALGAAVGGIASGRVPVGNAEGDLLDSWVNPTSMLVGALAVTSAAFIAAIYLAGDAKRGGLDDLAATFRKRALASGALVGAIAICGPLVLRADARDLYDGLASFPALGAGLLSGVFGVISLALIYRWRFEPARASSAVAVAAIIAGWGLAQDPSFLPGLTLEEAAAGDATLTAMAVAVGVGMLILIPSLALLFRLVLTGRFDPGRELPATDPEESSVPEEPEDTSEAEDRAPEPPVPLMAVLGTTGVGVLVTLVGEGWLLGVGVAVMLAGGVLAFVHFAAPQEGDIGA